MKLWVSGAHGHQTSLAADDDTRRHEATANRFLSFTGMVSVFLPTNGIWGARGGNVVELGCDTAGIVVLV